MPQTVTLRIGERQPLRALGEVARWTSDRPNVASVTDEDYTTGRRGGEVTALAAGQTRIRALGFDGEALLEVQITVGGAEAVVLGVGETRPLDTLGPARRWTVANAQVAEVAQDGTLRGVSPGITLVRGEGEGAGVEAEVRVTGALELEVNQSLPLANRFSRPVREWRAGSSSVAITSDGVLTAGDRPLSVPVTAVLADGEEFTFDVRMVRPSVDRSLSDAERSTAVAPMTQQTGGGARPADDLLEAHTLEAEQHREREQALGAARQWAQAGAERLARRLVEAQDDTLRQRHAEEEARRDEAAREMATASCLETLQAMERGDYARARALLGGLRLPGSRNRLATSLRELPDRLEALATADDDTEPALNRLEASLSAAWTAAVTAEVYPALVGLVAVAVVWDAERLAQQVVDTYGTPAVSEFPETVRRDLEIALKPMAAAAVEAVLRRLAITPGADPSGRWVLDLYGALEPAKACRRLLQVYTELPEPAQAQLIAWLSKLADESWGKLFDVLAGTLNLAPPDRRQALALQARIGSDRLRKAAVQWACRGHRGAQTVLRVLYDYRDTGFTR